MKIAIGFLLFLLSATSALAASVVTAQAKLEPNTTNKQASTASGYVFGVTVKSIEQLDAVLNRAGQLQSQFDPSQHGKISIVLHGEELALFQKNNQSFDQGIVKKARLLDQLQVIDIKACQSRMRSLDIGQHELPDFIEQVPLAPVEIRRLVEQKGFTPL